MPFNLFFTFLFFLSREDIISQQNLLRFSNPLQDTACEYLNITYNKLINGVGIFCKIIIKKNITARNII